MIASRGPRLAALRSPVRVRPGRAAKVSGLPSRSADRARRNTKRSSRRVNVARVASWGDRVARQPPGRRHCFACRCLAADTVVKSNGLHAVSVQCLRAGLLLVAVFLPGATRGHDPDRLGVTAGHSLGFNRAKIVRVFEFMSLSCAPSRIRTCAHGSGEGCCARP
jgi:hypothetical protein